MSTDDRCAVMETPKKKGIRNTPRNWASERQCRRKAVGIWNALATPVFGHGEKRVLVPLCWMHAGYHRKP